MKKISVSVAVAALPGVAAHSEHVSHETVPGVLPLIGVGAGVLIAAAGLFLSLKKYRKLSERETS